MRGPRVDHPRRSNFEFFSPCVSVKETQEMYANMMGEMLKTIPEIKTFFSKQMMQAVVFVGLIGCTQAPMDQLNAKIKVREKGLKC